jgi:hypothetical protein
MMERAWFVEKTVRIMGMDFGEEKTKGGVLGVRVCELTAIMRRAFGRLLCDEGRLEEQAWKACGRTCGSARSDPQAMVGSPSDLARFASLGG